MKSIKHKKAAGTALAVVLIGLMTLGALAATYEPGSENDPVVTLSYVEMRLSELMEAFQPRLESLEAAAGQTGSQTGEAAAETYEVVFVEAGRQIYFADSTQVILRAGAMTAIGNAAGDGLADLTGGKDLKSGDPIAKNHLLLVPRNDGRGAAVAQDAWIMIKGRYTLQ